MRGRKPALYAIDGGLSEEMPAPPDWLHDDAREEWDRVAPDLHAKGRLTESTLAPLEAYCNAVAAVRRCQRLVAEQGDIIQTKGGFRKHPAYQVITSMTTEMRRLASELGITRGQPAGGGSGGGERRDDLFSKLGIV